MFDRRWISGLAIAMLFVACEYLGPSAVVDGWPIGATHDCRQDDAECLTYVPTATDGFDRRDPGHAAIVRTTLHEQGAYLHDDGEFRRPVCLSGCFTVVVFELADGAVRAIGVGTVGISQVATTRDYGPLVGPP